MTDAAEGGADGVVLVATLVCPRCGHAERATMPEDACRVVWLCPGCDARLTPEAGDCCVFCSYGDRPCPPVQRRHSAPG